MKNQVNGWTVIVALAFGYAFSYFTTQQMIPAVAAQIGANEQVITAVNEALVGINKSVDERLTKIEARLDAEDRLRASTE